MNFSKSIFFALVFMAFAGETFSRSGWLVGADSLNAGRRNGVYIGYVAGPPVTYAVRYRSAELSYFRFYNDYRSWLQMDKLRHMALVYQLGEYGTGMLRWAGVDNKNPDLLGKIFLDSWHKDYNGQTNWISFSPGSFIENSRLPSWLCLSIGAAIPGIADSLLGFRVCQGPFSCPGI